MMKHLFNLTAAARVAVVFLLLALTGCAMLENSEAENAANGGTATQAVSDSKDASSTTKARRKRRRASDYSRIPVNAPAEWQRQSLGY